MSSISEDVAVNEKDPEPAVPPSTQLSGNNSSSLPLIVYGSIPEGGGSELVVRYSMTPAVAEEGDTTQVAW
jgi:hypothetical protein